jgi:hypothetical protein
MTQHALSDVIEHTRDPLAVLQRVWRAVKPGGAIFVATPSLDSWSARLLRDRWMEFKAEHLFYFDSATLESLLVRAGFEAVRSNKGRKTLTPGYVIAHFERFPVPGVSPLEADAPCFLERSARRRRVASGIGAVARREPLMIGIARVSVVMPVSAEKKTFSTVMNNCCQADLNRTHIVPTNPRMARAATFAGLSTALRPGLRERRSKGKKWLGTGHRRLCSSGRSRI